MGKEQKKPKTILEELKGDYDNRLVSALVGAGFSKNVSDSFMGWGELLQDMVEELYAVEIRKGYDNYLHLNKCASEELLGEKEFCKVYIKNVLDNENCLEIVSNYVKHKGYREAVEVYIEDRIPYVGFNDKNDIVLKKRDKEVQNLTGDIFSAHKELLLAEKLQNIYTTNYENLIEFAVKLLPPGTRETPSLITSGKELSNKIRNRNIIKIHGDLVMESTKKRGFDGDNKLCYIIAQEDYDSYKVKHEAFTSLMRIAMLQGKFMLLGFSGSDANYQGWVNWMSDVLEGADDKSTKIYIIDVSGKPVTPGLQLHYDNHHTKVVNLIKHNNLQLIGFEEKEIVSILEKKELDNDTKREVLTRFLKYLHTDLTSGEEFSSNNNDDFPPQNQDDKVDNGSSSLPVSDFSTIKPCSYDYRKLWGEALSKIEDIDSIDDIVKRIKNAKPQNRFPKIVSNQESVTFEIMRKSKLNDKDAFLFALAVDELGLNPHYYSQVVQDYEELNKLPLWNLLKTKESTFNGDDSMLQDDTDECTYENIQRLLFHLDFEKANELIESWSPSNSFILQKAMRLAAINNRQDEAKELLSSYIPTEASPIAKLYAMQVANHISGQFPRPYKYDEFYRYGIDGIGDNLNYMVQQLRGKLEKPNYRGWIGATTSFGGGNPDYEKSLRILRYISDVGIYVNFRFSSFFDIASWYLVFQNLYKEFPYPCFFYSIQYSDNNVLTRIGQDFAYTPELLEFNKDILIRAIDAIGKDSMPNELYIGMLYVTGPIYMVVDEEEWFTLFKESLFKKLIDNFDKADYSDSLVKNVGNALVSLKKPQNIKYIFSELLAHYKENHKLADIFIKENLHTKYIIDPIPQEIQDLLIKLISEYPNVDTTELIYVLDQDCILTKEIKELFVLKVSETKQEKLSQTLALAFYLCLLTKDHPDTLRVAKSNLLKLNIWHCGVMDNGKGWSAPNYLRLNTLKTDEIKWTDDEFKRICENLENNILKFDEANDMLSKSPFGRNTQTRYLSDVLRFIDGQDEEKKELLTSVRNKTEKLLQNRISYKNLIEGMLSDQPADIDSVMDDVMHGIDAQGLSMYLDEFNFILDKAIVGEGTTINRALGLIRCVVNDYPKDIIELKLNDKLHVLLSVYKDRWSTLQEFKPVWSFNYLRTIASFLKDNGHKDSDVVSYWLNDPYVQLFIRT